MLTITHLPLLDQQNAITNTINTCRDQPSWINVMK